MTIDKAKLKALAEAANAVTGAANVEITICSEVGPNQAEIDAVTTFAGVSTPAAVLALLAEIERLEMDNRSLKGSCSKLGAEHAGMSRLYKKANRMQFEARQERDQLKAERDCLQSQVAALQAEPNSYQSGFDAGQRSHRVTVDRITVENDHLRNGIAAIRVASGAGDDPVVAHVTGLRRDAERYRRMRAMTLAQMDDTTEEFDSEFDSQLDAAIGNGEQP